MEVESSHLRDGERERGLLRKKAIGGAEHP